MAEFIKDYQSLIGSFLALTGSLAVFCLAFFVNKRKEIADSKKEIEKIFLMASRECDLSIDDLKLFSKETQKQIENKKGKMDVFIAPRFNRIFINEERLFALSKNLDNITSQQVDIAVSAIKRFNGYLDQFEEAPKLIFDFDLKSLQAGVITKEEAIKDYEESQKSYIENIKKCLNNEIKIVRRHILRPIIIQQINIKQVKNEVSIENLDKQLDDLAEKLLIMNGVF